MNRLVVAVALGSAALLTVNSSTASGEPGWVYPVGPANGPPAVVAGFNPPGQPWLAGHRGVDLAGISGETVRSAGPGKVSYAGQLAGRGVVVVDHGAVRTTYEPLQISVAVGQAVNAGEPLGILTTSGGHCLPTACLHWGARTGTDYLDPLSLIDSSVVRLLPLGERTLSGDPPALQPPGSGRLTWPVVPPVVTSPFGMRVHPVTGVYKLHDGTDFAAACGAPVRAAADGRITHAGTAGAYGLQVSVEHSELATSYSHLSRIQVMSGTSVTRGQIIGLAGDTGLATGCHLHFMVHANGTLSDPMTWLPTGAPPSAKATGWPTRHVAASVRRRSVQRRDQTPLHVLAANRRARRGSVDQRATHARGPHHGVHVATRSGRRCPTSTPTTAPLRCHYLRAQTQKGAALVGLRGGDWCAPK